MDLKAVTAAIRLLYILQSTKEDDWRLVENTVPLSCRDTLTFCVRTMKADKAMWWTKC
jgi:hypothetical protein